ncbi:hypothetical protein [Larkinella sp. C7]|uniref:hypothetical protein n=1 Tax=Larkinella sp. C7 TaxID=2576607 RepID=UPI00111110E7
MIGQDLDTEQVTQELRASLCTEPGLKQPGAGPMIRFRFGNRARIGRSVALNRHTLATLLQFM